MRVNFQTLGCRLNEAETESWAETFQLSGDTIVRTPQQADVIVLNTCAVTTEASRKSRQLIRRLHQGNPRAKLVVSGCHSTLNPEQTALMLGVDLVVANQDKEKLVRLTRDRLFPEAGVNPANSADISEPLFVRGRQRAFIKVQDGCRYRCTFCIVTHARGDERSRSIDDIIAQIRNLHDHGIQEIIVTGVHLGGYGSDSGCDLTTLIETILDRTAIPRVRLGSLEPWDLPGHFFDLFADPRLMPHLHLPLQSGSDSVLKRMARRCKTAEFRRLNDRARSLVPDLNITTDIIVGFPGESAQEWSESLATIEALGFGHIHIFSYSARQGTRAASLPDAIPANIKKQRSKELHALARSMKNATYNRYIGRQFPVLWENGKIGENRDETLIFGYTPNFLRVAVATADSGLDNTIRTVRLNGFNPGDPYARGTLKSRELSSETGVRADRRS